MQASTKKMVITASIIGALVIVVIAFVIRSKRKKLEAKIKEGSSDIIIPAKETTSSIIFPLKRGSGITTAEKNAVKLVQRYINAKTVLQWWLRLGPLEEDGIFGPITETALSRFAGVKEVSYSLYKEMQSYLYKVPAYLSPETPAYKAPASTDPAIQKNDISVPPLTLFS